MEYIALDLGGSALKYGVLRDQGVIRDQGQLEHSRDITGAELLRRMEQVIAERMDDEIGGIGVSTLGTVDVEHGVVTGACENLPGVCDLPIKEHLEQEFQVRVRVINDASAAALGEARFGAGRDLDRFYCLTLGTGIGGAYVTSGRVLNGVHGMAGEVGYLMRNNGVSWEQRASVNAFLNMCRASGERRTDGHQIFADALAGRTNSQIFTRWLKQVAEGICEIIYLLDPGTILIGGGVSCYGRKLCDPLEKAVEQAIHQDFREGFRLAVAAAGNHANLLGAAALFMRSKLK